MSSSDANQAPAVAKEDAINPSLALAAAAAPDATRKRKPKGQVAAEFSHHVCRTALQCLQISLPFVFILEGFDKPQTALMRLSQGERIVVFSLLRILRESLIFSPIMWGTLLIQCWLARMATFGRTFSSFWCELLVVQSSVAVGMAAVRCIRKGRETGEG